MTGFAERFREEGMRQGLQQGMQQGRREGVQEGEARLLIRLLETRFGCLTDEQKALIHRAETGTLLLWSERVLVAKSLSEVFQ